MLTVDLSALRFVLVSELNSTDLLLHHLTIYGCSDIDGRIWGNHSSFILGETNYDTYSGLRPSYYHTSQFRSGKRVQHRLGEDE